MSGKNKGNNLKVIAYCQVNGVDKNDADKPEHKKIISSALRAVANYDGLYPGENEALRERRYDYLDAVDAGGGSSDLASYFKELYPDELSGQVGWPVIFIVYNKLMSLTKGELDVKDTEPESEDESKTTETILNKTEVKEMANSTENVKTLEGLANEISAGIGAPAGSMPKSANGKATLEAVKSELEATRNSRIIFSKTAKVIKVVAAKPTLAQLLAKGKDTKGMVENPEETLKKFKTKFGVIEDEAGNVQFTKCAPDPVEKENAAQIYAALKAAVADPSKQFDIYVKEDAIPAIKGFALKRSSDASAEYMTTNAILEVILQESASALDTSKDGVQLRAVTAARRSAKQGTRGQGTARANKATTNPYSGIATVRVTEKKSALQDGTLCEYWKEKTEKVDRIRGPKSAISAKYVRNTTNENNEPTLGTYRIPLVAEQYVTEVASKELVSVFGDGNARIGSALEAINFDDANKVTEIFGKMEDILKNAAMSDVKTDMIAKINEKSNAISADAVAKDAAEVGANL